MLTLQQKASIRRHLGVPAAGRIDSNTTLGLRTVTRAGQLELYMNVLQPEEEAILLGKPYGAFIIYSPVVVGTVYSFTIGATTVSYTVAPADAASQDPLFTVASGLLTQIQQNLPAYMAQRNTISALNNGLGMVTTSAVQFSLLPASGSGVFTVVGGVGSNVVVVAVGNTLPSPVFVVDDGNGNAAAATIAYGLLPICDALESAFINTSQNQSFLQVGSANLGQAAFRQDELVVRFNLLTRYRRMMGVMLSFYSPNGNTGINTTSYQV